MANGLSKYPLSILYSRVWSSVGTDISVVLERNAAYLTWIMKRHLESARKGFIYKNMFSVEETVNL